MNMQNFETLKAALLNGIHTDALDVLFDMEHFWSKSDNSCGSVACIAGHASILMGKKDPPESSRDHVVAFAEYLEIPYVDAKNIAYAYYIIDYNDGDYFNGCIKNMAAITAADAIKVLEIYRDTGKVEWIKATEGNPDIQLDEEY